MAAEADGWEDNSKLDLGGDLRGSGSRDVVEAGGGRAGSGYGGTSCWSWTSFQTFDTGT